MVAFKFGEEWGNGLLSLVGECMGVVMERYSYGLGGF